MITITFGSWIIPLSITSIGICWALFYVKNTDGLGLTNLMALIPALAISCVSWILWGVFK